MVTGEESGSATAAVMGDTKSTGEERDKTMAMFIMAGMVVSSAGFAMYSRQADSLLKRMSRASKIQGLAKASYKTKPKSNPNSKPSEKDDLF
mmetsp:Transcript_11484/g.26969  ORF Transcript_11484/g.26969 Transcript_11484/m.26969 type:complete len:92 (+) Transcript_11484:133-408(+)